MALGDPLRFLIFTINQPQTDSLLITHTNMVADPTGKDRPFDLSVCRQDEPVMPLILWHRTCWPRR